MSRTPYPTDLTDRQWRLIEPYVPRPKPGGRPARYTRREIVNAILYQTRVTVRGDTPTEARCLLPVGYELVQDGVRAVIYDLNVTHIKRLKESS